MNRKLLCAVAVGLLALAQPGASSAAGDGADLSSPRAAVKSYLTACRDGDYALGAKHLDLREIRAGERAERGPSLARRLKLVLDQKLWVELERLSDSPDGHHDDALPPGLDRVGTIESEAGSIDVLVARREGSWRIAAATVARIPDLYAEFGFGTLGEYLPATMFTRYGELELWQWLGLIVALVAAYLLGLILAAGLMRLSRRLVRKTESTFDDQLLKAGAGPLTATATVALFNATTLPLRLSVPAQRVVGEVCQALIVVTITWLAMRIVDLGVGLIEDRFRERGETTAITVLPIGRRVVKVFLIILAVLSGLQNMGYNVTGLVAGLGVGGLAVALAAQKTFEDFFGAMSILVDQPIKRGEFGRFGDKVGTVEDIGLRSTRIRTSERTLVTIPNAEFASLQIENFTARDRIRFVTILGLRYETSADQLRHVLIRLRELLREHPQISPDPARVRFIGFGASSLDIEVFAYFTTVDWNEFMSLREELLLRMIDLVEASGTGFAFPSQTLYLGSDAGLDETRAREAERQIQAWRSDGSLEGKT